VLVEADGPGSSARKRPRVLVAGTLDAIEIVVEALRGDADIVPARSVEEAVSRCGESQFDTIACDVRFDESRMFNFLQALMEQPSARAARVVCFRLHGGELSPSMRNAIQTALEALGVWIFLDLHQLKAEYGAEVARETLRQIILNRIGARRRTAGH
jgi:hypothetical protein